MYLFYRLFLFLGLLSIISPTLSQTMEWGDEVRAGSNYIPPIILGVENEHIYWMQWYYNENAPNTIRLYISYFTDGLKQVKGKEIFVKPAKEKRVYLGTRLRKEGICIFVADKVPNKNVVQIKTEIYDLETLELTETRVLKSFPSKKIPQRGEIVLYTAPDSPYFCIFWRDRLDDNKKSYEVTFRVYDEKMNSVWEKNISQLQAGNTFSAVNVDILENGDVLIGGYLYRGEKIRKITPLQTPNYTYQGIAYRNHGTDSSLFSLDLGKMFIRNSALFTTPEGKIICAGFYNQVDSRDAWEQIYQGTYFAFVDTQQLAQTAKMADFAEITRYNEKGEESIVNKNDGYKDYRTSQILFANNGHTYLLVRKSISVRGIFTFDEQANRIGSILFSHEKREFVFPHVQGGDIFMTYLNKLPKSQRSPLENRGLFCRKLADQGTTLGPPFTLEDQLIVNKPMDFPIPQYQLNEDTWVVTQLTKGHTYQIGTFQFSLP